MHPTNDYRNHSCEGPDLCASCENPLLRERLRESQNKNWYCLTIAAMMGFAWVAFTTLKLLPDRSDASPQDNDGAQDACDPPWAQDASDDPADAPDSEVCSPVVHVYPVFIVVPLPQNVPAKLGQGGAPSALPLENYVRVPPDVRDTVALVLSQRLGTAPASVVWPNACAYDPVPSLALTWHE